MLKRARVIKAVESFLRRTRRYRHLIAECGALCGLRHCRRQVGTAQRCRKVPFGRVTSLPGSLRRHFRGVLDLHPLVDVNRNVGRIQQAKCEDAGKNRKFERGCAALILSSARMPFALPFRKRP